MTSWRVFVHGSLSNFTVLAACIKKALKVWNSFTNNLGQILDIYATIRIFFDLQGLFFLGSCLWFFFFCIWTKLGQQIEDLLIVDLKISAAHKEVFATIICIIKEAENMIYGLRNDSLKILPVCVYTRLKTHHCMTFAAAGLSICKDSTYSDDSYHISSARI